MLTYRDIRVRYKQSVMGFLWAILMPALILLAGIIVRWKSVNGVQYLLQRSTNLLVQPVFPTIQENIPGQGGATSY